MSARLLTRLARAEAAVAATVPDAEDVAAQETRRAARIILSKPESLAAARALYEAGRGQPDFRAWCRSDPVGQKLAANLSRLVNEGRRAEGEKLCAL